MDDLNDILAPRKCPKVHRPFLIRRLLAKIMYPERKPLKDKEVERLAKAAEEDDALRRL